MTIAIAFRESPSTSGSRNLLCYSRSVCYSRPHLLFQKFDDRHSSLSLTITGWETSAVRKPRDWSKVIDKLNRSKAGELRVKMGSPGSAQVTRCRLLAQWNNLEAETVGATLVLRLPR